MHERGAPHLVDPTKLLASATRLYGDEMDRLWGEVRAVPEANLRVLRGGEALEGFEVAYTPGHASHHVSYWHPQTRTAFVGDVAGVRIAPSRYVLAPTPPPDIDVEAWQDSIARRALHGAAQLSESRTSASSHGCTSLAHLDALEERSSRVRRGGQAALESGLGRGVRRCRARGTSRPTGARDAAVYALGAPLDQTYAGLRRYWSKRDGAR